MEKDLDRFKELNFDKFKELAKDQSLSVYEKIGFPDSYREAYEVAIFADILNKLSNLNLKQQVVIDIGPGCSALAHMLIDFCKEHEHTLILIDSKEMLSFLPNADSIIKVAAKYPDDCEQVFLNYKNKVNVILCYSVLHYIFAESNLFTFLDKSLSLLCDNGQFLLGDIPNISKRKRFFSSAGGISYHQEFTGKKELPEVEFNTLNENHIDDAVLLSMLLRARASGFDSYLLPQATNLPMSNRREDLLFHKP